MWLVGVVVRRYIDFLILKRKKGAEGENGPKPEKRQK